MLIDNDLTFLSVLNIDNDNNNEKCKLYKSSEGFIKGNMFENEYMPYKNYKSFFPKTNCEKTALLYEIMELEFAVLDLNLWLDLNPNDNYVYMVLKEYMKKLSICESNFINKYGPLEIEDNVYDHSKWINGWPWEKEDSVYV